MNAPLKRALVVWTFSEAIAAWCYLYAEADVDVFFTAFIAPIALAAGAIVFGGVIMAVVHARCGGCDGCT